MAFRGETVDDTSVLPLQKIDLSLKRTEGHASSSPRKSFLVFLTHCFVLVEIMRFISIAIERARGSMLHGRIKFA